MNELRAAVETVRKRIAKYRGSRKLNEENTKAVLIEPVLRALGWDVEDLEEVQREFKVKRSDRPVDYALLVLRTPRLLVEAKGLGENLDDRRWSSQIMGYAAVAGVEWTVLTNGDEYRVYNSHATVAVDEKLFRTVRISDPESGPVETLQLLSREKMQENRLEALWRAHFVDRQVRAAIDQVFSPEKDMALVNWIKGRTKDLTAPEIRASLGRCQMTLDFPLDLDASSKPPVASKRARRAPVAKAPKSGGAPKPAPVSSEPQSVSLASLIQAGIVSAPLDLFRSYKGQELRGRVEADGSVSFAGESYKSPSTAAGAARASIVGRRKDGRLPATNGWTFWCFVDRSGTERDLAYLRHEPGNRAGKKGAAG